MTSSIIKENNQQLRGHSAFDYASQIVDKDGEVLFQVHQLPRVGCFRGYQSDGYGKFIHLNHLECTEIDTTMTFRNRNS